MYAIQGKMCKPYKMVQKAKKNEAKITNGKPDWALYMKNVEAEIKKNWNPPKNKKSYRVVLVFKIGKNGELLSYKVQKGVNKKANEAALKALKDTAPFEYLPKEYEGDYIPIEFTFDYNVIDIQKEKS